MRYELGKRSQSLHEDIVPLGARNALACALLFSVVPDPPFCSLLPTLAASSCQIKYCS